MADLKSSYEQLLSGLQGDRTAVESDHEENGVLSYEDKDKQGEDDSNVTLHDTVSGYSEDRAGPVIVDNTPLARYLNRVHSPSSLRFESVSHLDSNASAVSFPTNNSKIPSRAPDSSASFSFISALESMFPLLSLSNPYKRCVENKNSNTELFLAVIFAVFFSFLSLVSMYSVTGIFQFVSLVFVALAFINLRFALLYLKYRKNLLSCEQHMRHFETEFEENCKLVKKAIKMVMEIEMVSRGYHLSPLLGAVVRLDANTPETYRHSRYMRTVLSEVLNACLSRLQQCSPLVLLLYASEITPPQVCVFKCDSLAPSIAELRSLHQILLNAKQSFTHNFSKLDKICLGRPSTFWSSPPSLLAARRLLDEVRVQVCHANELLSNTLQPISQIGIHREGHDELQNLILSAYNRLMLAQQRCLEVKDLAELRLCLEEDVDYVCSTLSQIKPPATLVAAPPAAMFGQQEQTLLQGSLEAALMQLRETKLDDGSGEVFLGSGALTAPKNQWTGSAEPEESAFSANLAILKELQSVIRHRQNQTYQVRGT